MKIKDPPIQAEFADARDKAEKGFLESLDIRDRVLGKKHVLYGNTLHALGVFYG